MIEIIDTIPSLRKTLHKSDINNVNTRTPADIIDRESKSAAQEGDKIKFCWTLGKIVLLFLTSAKQNNYLILQTACLSTHSA